ncbi:MAG: hypothetical protein Q4D62_14005 [Planctomycetia bacterium]|nr:hypothetical protein [Planctomycetia bacterium]
MMDNIIYTGGVCLSLLTGLTLAQFDLPPGLDQMGAVAVLGLVLWYFMTRLNTQNDEIKAHAMRMENLIKAVQEDVSAAFVKHDKVMEHLLKMKDNPLKNKE